jgi:phospholipid/cholesterol/gamma-HCH transport system permease protein
MLKPLRLLSRIGEVTLFGTKAIAMAFVPPFEFQYLIRQLQDIGSDSVGLISAAGIALGVVMTLHTRSTLVRFGAEAWIPQLQSISFFNELGPLMAGLLVAGRVGAGIGAELANMRATEQIDAIEVMSIDSFKFLVSTRILACTIALPLLTLFLDFTALIGGFIAETVSSHMSIQQYIYAAFTGITWVMFIAPTMKACVFGFLIGVISCFFGFTINEGSDGVRRAATRSVVVSSLMVIGSDVLLVKLIFFFFPGGAV